MLFAGSSAWRELIEGRFGMIAIQVLPAESPIQELIHFMTSMFAAGFGLPGKPFVHPGGGGT